MGVAGTEDELQQQETEDEPQGGDEQETLEGVEGEDTIEGGAEEEETVVQIGNEEAPASEDGEAETLRFADLRKRYRESQQELKKLRATQAGGAAQAEKPTLPPKPKLADYDYDEEKYEQARDSWDEAKRQHDAWESNQQERVRQAQEAQRKLNEAYTASKTSLKVKDFEAAEEAVTDEFNEWQQAVIKAGASNPGAMVYALGKNPAKLRELASIKDPVKFTFAVAKLEDKVTVTTRAKGAKPAPEVTLRGGGSGSGTQTSKATLDRLEAEAAKTGDRTKVVNYKRQMSQAKT